MSNAINDLLAREESKLARQLANHEATKVELEILGDTSKVRNKLAKQENDIKATKANIAKLKKAAG